MAARRCTPAAAHRPRSGGGAVQMFKILAVNSLVASYTLSVLTLDGCKLGDVQAMLCTPPASAAWPLGRPAPVWLCMTVRVLAAITRTVMATESYPSLDVPYPPFPRPSLCSLVAIVRALIPIFNTLVTTICTLVPISNTLIPTICTLVPIIHTLVAPILYPCSDYPYPRAEFPYPSLR
jgi:hypothetical protein